MRLRLDEFKLIRDFIHERTGFYLKDEKLTFLETRVDNRCRFLNCEEGREYYRILKYDASGQELAALMDLVITNETYFFRNLQQLKAFSLESLPEIVKRRKEEGIKEIKIWSAGCSTGDEPYTLAMLAKEVAKDMKIEVIATDLNTRVIEHGKKGFYCGRSLKDVPQEYLSKYFTKNGNGYNINDEIKNIVKFWSLNLCDRGHMLMIKNVDYIFCRNVLIYFSTEMAKKVVRMFYDSMNKGGVLFLGYSESMHLLSSAYRLTKFKEAFGYRKE